MTDEQILKECKERIEFHSQRLYGEKFINKRREVILGSIIDDKDIDYKKANSSEDFEDLLNGVVCDCLRFRTKHPQTWQKNPTFVINYITKKFVYPPYLPKFDDKKLCLHIFEPIEKWQFHLQEIQI